MDKQTVKVKAKELLETLSLEQKLGQISGMFTGKQIPIELLYRFKNGVGELGFAPGDASKEDNYERVQKEIEIMTDACGIPAIRHNEALSGQLTADSTVFPSAIGLGASWSPETVTEMTDYIRKQMLAEGTRQALSPVMDVARDPRWGRVGETYGEDPTLCAAMSVAFVKGLQTDNLEDGIIATGKHFLGYSTSEGGLNMASNPISEREVREIYAKPFQAAITEADLGSIMNSYGAIDNEVIIGSKRYLSNLLRDEMKFDGVVVSDYMSVNKLVDLGICETPEDGGKKAVKAGLDVELPTPYGYTAKMIEHIEEDSELQEAIDKAALRVLEAKVKLGFFEKPIARKELLTSAYDAEEGNEKSLRMAQKTIVLLKNDGILPLDKNVSKVAVIGPHADSVRLMFGCYTYPAMFERDTTGSMADMPGMQGLAKDNSDNPYRMDFYPGTTIRRTHPYIEETLRELYKGKIKTIVEVLQEKCQNAQIRYAKGADVAGTDTSGFAEAKEAAEWADVVIVVGGGQYGWGSSSTTGEGIDCDRIGLSGVQSDLAELIVSTGTPAVYVHMDSKPLCEVNIAEHYNAVLENWFPGQTGGSAIADVLFGDYNPAGRLPMTAPRNEGQIPIYYGQKNGSGYHPGKGMTIAKYAEGTKEPLYCFGHGLSYTVFEYSNLQITPEVNADGTVEISCIIKNTGNADGEEVVQVYVRDECASMLRPNMELAGFKRVIIKAGEAKTVVFKVRADQFAFLNEDMDWIVEAGKMSVFVGASSEDIRLKGEFRILDTIQIDGAKRGFYAATQVQ